MIKAAFLRPGFRLFSGAIIVLTMGLAACGGDGGSTETQPKEFNAPTPAAPAANKSDLFDPNRLIQVDITLPANQFETLRNEGRTLASTARSCLPEHDYNEFNGTVRIDGQTLNNVAIRKKGFIGSLSYNRPSLKLDFNTVEKGQTYQNATGMTLNNNRQDASNARQCLAYDLFRAAGVSAPRCNFAEVRVNGESLGIYSHVEPIKKPFLARSFGDDSGNLYESQTADFGVHLNERFEKKTNTKDADRRDLTAVAEALQLDDAALVNVLPQLIDVDGFIRLWAMETLLGLWDSTSGNANNFYLYKNPKDQLFYFIPWGADTAFSATHPLKPGSGPLYRNFSLTSRLYGIERWRKQYEETLRGYLNTLWKEETLMNELGRIRAITATTAAAQRHVQQFIQGQAATGSASAIASQRQRLEKALASQDAAGKPSLLKDEAANCAEPETTALTGKVTSRSGADSGSFKFTLPNGHQVDASLYFAAFQVDSLVYSVDDSTNPPVVSLLMIGADANAGYTPYVLQVFIESPQFKDGSQRLHGFATNAMLFSVDKNNPKDIRALALGATGAITLEGTSGFASKNGTGGNLDVTFDLSLEYVPTAIGARSAN